MMAGTKELFNEQYRTGGRGSHRLGVYDLLLVVQDVGMDLDELGDWARKKDM